MHDALTRTLAAGTARVRQQRHSTAGELITSEEGVTDFAARRTRTQLGATPALDGIVEALEARWPWLHEEESGEPSGAIYAGTVQFFVAGDEPTVTSPGTPQAPMRCHADPAWILEALGRAHVSTDGPAFTLDLTRRTGPLQIPPHHGSAPPLLAGAIETDEEGRIRCVTWRDATYRRRPRGPGRPRPTGTGATTVEMWDFGLPVDIIVPHVPRRLPGTAVVDVARAAWYLRNRRRDWMRRAPG